eukprot:NODE_343_length_10566_cov_0.542371.p6 type:complete len:141 gc:universal NODE_343_length_10566_cov_0.542371:10007-9585(-)
MILSIWIVNKAGSLIYSKEYNTNKQSNIRSLSSNDAIVLASTLHSLTAISSRVSPIVGTQPSQGLRQIITSLFTIHLSSTVTGVKFIILATNGSANIDSFFSKLYEVYSDYVVKNAFYTLEHPIKNATFDQQLETLIKLN